MSAEQFFNKYTSWLEPSLERKEKEGDYYNSPLQHFYYVNEKKQLVGYGKEKGQLGYQVAPYLMKIKEEPISLDKLAYPLENKIQELALKERISIICFNEACLHIQGVNRKEKPLPSFFTGFKKFISGKENITDSRAIISRPYDWLLHAALALTWAANNSIPQLSEESLISERDFSVSSSDVTTGMLLERYKSLYISDFEKIKPYLERNLSLYLSYNPNFSNQCFFHGRRGVNREINKLISFELSFPESPFNKLFHKVNVDNYDNLDFGSPESYIEFRPYKYGTQPLWLTLLLIDLHKQNDYSGNIEFIPGHPMNTVANQPVSELGKLTTTDPNAEPKAAGMIYERIMSKKSKSSRFVRTALEITTSKLIEEPAIEMSDWRTPESSSIFDTWNITLSMEASLLEEGLWLHIDAFCYHDKGRTLIPCEIISEFESTKDDKERIYFEIGLDRTVIQMLEFEPNGDNIKYRPGFTSHDGEGWLLIVFKK